MALQPLDASQVNSREGGPSFSLSNRLFRALWNLTWALLASWTPPPFGAWRRFLLTLFGARMGVACDVRGTAKVWYPPHLQMADRSLLADRVNCYNMAPISLGERALVSQGAHLCAGSHDIRTRDFQLIAKPIHIGADVWVAAEAFVGPGVEIGEGSVLGARAVAFKSLEPWGVYAGNPAQFVKRRVILGTAGDTSAPGDAGR
ncbi:MULTISPECIES: putative colanic acid biosynthesis acetyltransferase [unclassified Variovorax]|jgi:putative colanic acid biosynthesis acetyltransferase WcaF|uniref:putative colanic acid biosynthesis acetyltransferase n=1 Tax=unclassified Variovorax TaxID=663243 RepID=UPI0019BFA392|nr:MULTISPECIES: putative colanic acid biosynthesis acetyltransferase [unclassified Variovorax]MBC7394632.1 putative colanic acid biosynthesis acetyltransferase [Variovorax sp.]MEB0055819.1 putative colanic acid biosynthesis acetyltransferase [Variovorax sp. LG9.2]